jgi:hypothetical protein
MSSTVRIPRAAAARAIACTNPGHSSTGVRLIA